MAVSGLNDDYKARINRVMDYIHENLDETLTLDKLARVAYFSPYHFHRVFYAMTGETLAQHIKRLRMERAATWLLANPDEPVTDIAYRSGFATPSAFGRAFKEVFGISATSFRVNPILKPRTPYCSPEQPPFGVNIIERPPIEIAYVRHIGPYMGDYDLFGRLWTELMKWAFPRGLVTPEAQMLCVYKDDPNITDDDYLRVDVCITVPVNIRPEGAIGRTTLPPGLMAEARFEINVDEYAKSWSQLIGGWLPNSGFMPDDRPCYERCLNDPSAHPEKKHIIDICTAIKPFIR